MKWLIKSLLAAVAVILSGCITEKDEPVWSLAPGDKLPDFSVTLSDGRRWSPADAAGKVCVIVLFNTGCGDCRRELPEVQKAYDALAGEAELVCIAREEDEAAVGAYWRENGLTLPYSPQPDRKIYSLFASSVIPRIYVADGRSVITAVFTDSDAPEAYVIVRAVAEAAGR